MPSTKPTKPKIIDFLDIGFGKGEHLSRYSRRGRRLVGIDKKKPRRRIPNAELWRRDAVEGLREIPDSNVRVLNSDFTLNEIKPDGHIIELFEQARRVLAHNGRFFIATDRQNADDFKRMLESCGFSVYQRDFTQEELDNPTTQYTKIRRDELRASPRSRSHWDERTGSTFDHIPIQMVARKKN